MTLVFKSGLFCRADTDLAVSNKATIVTSGQIIISFYSVLNHGRILTNWHVFHYLLIYLLILLLPHLPTHLFTYLLNVYTAHLRADSLERKHYKEHWRHWYISPGEEKTAGKHASCLLKGCHVSLIKLYIYNFKREDKTRCRQDKN